jgi:hypothetical protein
MKKKNLNNSKSYNTVYNPVNYHRGCDSVANLNAYNIRVGDVIFSNEHDPMWIDDLEREWTSKEIASKYDDDVTDNDIMPEDNICTFLFEDGSSITNIPGDAKFFVCRHIDQSELKLLQTIPNYRQY